MPVAKQKSVTIVNKRGLHARAAAKFVKIAGSFSADVQVSKGATQVSGVSIMGLMMLAASTGTDIMVITTGEDAERALNALVDLVQAGFHEQD